MENIRGSFLHSFPGFIHRDGDHVENPLVEVLGVKVHCFHIVMVTKIVLLVVTECKMMVLCNSSNCATIALVSAIQWQIATRYHLTNYIAPTEPTNENRQFGKKWV